MDARRPSTSGSAAQFGEEITAFEAEALQPWAVVAADAIAEVAAFCKADPDLAFDNLMCLSAVDYPKETPPRMEVVYHLCSYRHAPRLRAEGARCRARTPRVPTVEGVWGVANWHEREAYDMFGIVFDGHSDLRRILLPDDWVGYPAAQGLGGPRLLQRHAREADRRRWPSGPWPARRSAWAPSTSPRPTGTCDE